MRKILIVLLFVFISLLGGCLNNHNESEYTITGPNKVEIGKVIKIEINTDEVVIWESSHQNIATIKDGYVYGISLGKTIIKAYNQENLHVLDSILITVVEDSGVSDETIIISGDKEVEINSSITLVANTTVELNWYSSSTDIATVTSGVVTGVGFGTAIIRAEEVNNPLNYGNYIVTVIEKRIVITGPNKVRVGEEIGLTAQTTANVNWKSSDDNIATVDSNGNVRGLSVGKVIIRVQNAIYSSNYGVYEVEVLPPVDIPDTDYDYYHTKILALDEGGYRMELLNVPATNLSPNTEFMQWDGIKTNPITINDLYIGLENVYVAVGKQSKMIKKVMIDGEIGFSNIRVAIRKSISDIADNSTIYHDDVRFAVYGYTTIQTFDGLFTIEVAPNTVIVIKVISGKMVIEIGGVAIHSTNKRIMLIPNSGNIAFNSISRGQGIPRYEGNLEISLVKGRLLVVNDINLEAYLTKVVPSEMPSSWELEALKAQAVAARTYAYMDVLNKSNDRYGYTVDDSTKSQVYNNTNAQLRSTEAVIETKGIIMTYNNEPVQAYYYSSSSGLTASAHEVWIKDKVIDPIPYLIGQNLTADSNNDKIPFDPNSEASMLNFFKQIYMETPDLNSAYHRWRVMMTMQQLSRTINTNLFNTYNNAPESVLTRVGSAWVSKPIPTSIGNVSDIYVEERGSSGVVVSIVIVASSGTYKIVNQYNIRFTIRPKDAGSTVLRYYATNEDLTYYNSARNDSILLSGFFAIEKDGDNVYFYGGGNGHGVGMSQYGANGLATVGKNYQEILTTYYSNIDLTDITYTYIELNNYVDILK